MQKLSSVGVDFYYADLYQHLRIHYFPNGDVHTTRSERLERRVPAGAFSGDDVSAAVKRIQRGETKYRTFLREILDAGTATHSVYVTGKRAVYTGRQGDAYTEWFPGAS